MAIEMVDLPIKNGGSFHSYVNVYQRVSNKTMHNICPAPNLHAAAKPARGAAEANKTAASMVSRPQNWDLWMFIPKYSIV